MELQTSNSLRQEWLRAVRDHSAFLRDARGKRLTPRETHNLSKLHLLRIDVSYSRLKAAEEEALGIQ